MPRPLWSGNITFGLVNIPVSVVSALNREKSLDFELIDKRDKGHVGYMKYNKNTGEPVDSKFIVKGLHLPSGKYVMFEQNELVRFRTPGDSSIEIQQFVDRDEVNPMFFETPYYLLPGKKAGKTYVLLHDALEKTRKFAVGFIVMHTKKHLALIGAEDNALILFVVRYPATLKKPTEFEIPDPKNRDFKLNPREQAMAEALVEELTAPWKPQEFKDTYQEEVMAAVKRKSKQKVAEAPKAAAEEEGGQLLNLMPLLEKSLKAGRRTKKPRGKRAS